MVKKMFIEIRLCNPMAHDCKRHVKIVETYVVKFNVSILNGLKIMSFFVKAKYIHKCNVIWLPQDKFSNRGRQIMLLAVLLMA